ncbi:MAG: adenosylcobalamin-dependent ribonucleoside-diphosphate reductase [Candidatus Chisholmbacteria bacterium]|nr:adenosylcobalamin-dependent ribonucleoside-diphosphate reductase [Candidatus Chisholmbacteria bacterium]
MVKKVRLPKNALEILIRRYSLRDEQDRPMEKPEEILARVARVVAEAENQYIDEMRADEVAEKFYELLADLRFMPNGRTIANAGTAFGQLANCYVLPIEDEMGKTQDGIFSTLRNAALILQAGGGVGFSFGRIRPKGDRISTSKGKTTGAVSFIKIYDRAFDIIGQGGGRRSACMAILPVWHPDIWEFIHCKEKEGEIVNFNISVGITDEFMRVVRRDGVFELKNPHDGKVWERVRARKLFDELVRFAHHNGEPGVVFLDTANRDNPVPHMYQLEATNPCSEQWLGPYENCCLASINLAQHVRHKQQATSNKQQDLYPYEIDWVKLTETCRWVTRFLDDVVDANKYVSAVPQLEEAAKKNRRIGVSIMGLADMMYMVGVRYGSGEGEDLAGQVMEFIQYQVMRESIRLAKERGAFVGIKGSIYDKDNFIWKPKKPLVEASLKLGRPKIEWRKVIREIKKYGIRNAAQTTIAPTGAIATISGLEGYGCEPVFALSYVMRTHEGAQEGSDWRELYYESRLFREVLQRAGITGTKQRKIFEQVRETGSCQDIDEVPEAVKRTFVTAGDVTGLEHVRMQAALQRFVDNSISKTINLPAVASIDDVEKVYFKSWELGCKGMTVYVTGSRETVVLETPKRASASGQAQNGERKLNGEFGEMPRRLPVLAFREPDVSEGTCPECGSELRFEEGCATCPNCAYSHCSI